jgi:hypothetical protein
MLLRDTAAVIAIAAWPPQRYGPEREALAAVYHGLAALARRRDVDAGTAPELSDRPVDNINTLAHVVAGASEAPG